MIRHHSTRPATWISLGWVEYMYFFPASDVWRFPKVGVPLEHPCIARIFHEINHPMPAWASLADLDFCFFFPLNNGYLGVCPIFRPIFVADTYGLLDLTHFFSDPYVGIMVIWGRSNKPDTYLFCCRLATEHVGLWVTNSISKNSTLITGDG